MRTFPPLLVVVVASSASSLCLAERLPPKPVTPVTAEGVEYRAEGQLCALPGKDRVGVCVQAWTVKTKTSLWKRPVYEIVYDREREADIQDVFITTLQVVEGKLLITNEARERFEMDLSSGKVRALTGLGKGRRIPDVVVRR